MKPYLDDRILRVHFRRARKQFPAILSSHKSSPQGLASSQSPNQFRRKSLNNVLNFTNSKPALLIKVLNNVCGLIDDIIRDLVVSSIWKASLEGFMWVLLDGGPSRAFSDTDITMIEEDLNMLIDLFVAEGEGLPRSLVEEEAKFYRQILSLFSLQTESLIQMLMASSEHISVGLSSYKFGQRYLGDAHTLIRVLCHKKDREASKFLKIHYHLPSSSEYDETSGENASFNSPLMADILKRTTSFRWSEKGHSSFSSIKKKFQEATWK